MAEEQHVFIHVVKEPSLMEPGTLATLGWQDKCAVIAICVIGLWLLIKPLLEEWRRDAAVASADNVVKLK